MPSNITLNRATVPTDDAVANLLERAAAAIDGERAKDPEETK